MGAPRRKVRRSITRWRFGERAGIWKALTTAWSHPPLWIMWKYLRAGPPEMSLRNWYNCGTKHFHQTSVVWWNLKRNTQLDWLIKPVLHDLVRRIRFWRIKSPDRILNICTERQVKFFSEIYLPGREHTWLIGSGCIEGTVVTDNEWATPCI